MKELFPQYSDWSGRDHKKIWQDALFVFDTNVLLDLYRYQFSTREELIKLVSGLSNQIWLPHHVALEFQRNRLSVIADQNKRFSEVHQAVKKTRSVLIAELDKLQLQKRHSLIDPSQLISGFDSLVKDFQHRLSDLEKHQQKLTGPDALKQQIESLFNGKVGKAPEDQNEINQLYKIADERFKRNIPPGYRDSEKEVRYMHRNILYDSKYGDFVVWMQILQYARESERKSVIFVTDDGKEDWWLKIALNGLKIIGPRPELIEEAQLDAKVENFLMYSSEEFLKYAADATTLKISNEVLKEVRDVSRLNTISEANIKKSNKYLDVKQAVVQWLKSKFTSIEVGFSSFPDIVTSVDGNMYGYEIIIVKEVVNYLEILRNTVQRAYYAIESDNFHEFCIIYIIENSLLEGYFKKKLDASFINLMPDRLKTLIGILVKPPKGPTKLVVLLD